MLLHRRASSLLEGFLEQLVDVSASITTRLPRPTRRAVRLRERGHETGACALDTLVRGLGADAEQLAYLGRRPSLRVVEHDRDPVSGDEPAQCRPERQLVLGGGEHGRGIVDVRHQALELVWCTRREVSATAVRVDNSPGEGAAQPSTGGLWVAELLTRSPGALKRILDRVLGVVLLARETPCQRQQRRKVTLDTRLQATVRLTAIGIGCPVSRSHHVLAVGTSHESEVGAMSFVPFMRSATGRGLRIIAGGGLIAAGISIGGTGGVIIAVVGIVPLAAGVFNFCLAGPLFGVDLMGREHASR